MLNMSEWIISGFMLVTPVSPMGADIMATTPTSKPVVEDIIVSAADPVTAQPIEIEFAPVAEPIISVVEPEHEPAPSAPILIAAEEDIEEPENVEKAPVVLAQLDELPEPVTREVKPPALNKTEALMKANEALNAIGTAKGRFNQIDYAGRFSQGSFSLNRPGRLRFEYDDPVPLLIVSDGTTVAIEDRDLETVDRVPLASTPLNLLLRKNTDLAAHANILSIAQKGGLIAIRVSDRSGEAEGELELFFDPVDYELRQWESIDMNGAITTVQLIDTEKDVKLSPRLFRLEDPEDEDDRRR